MYVKSTWSTISCGDSEASSRHSGWPSRRQRRSHAALTTAPMAMCITPFSGPSQRSWPSQVSSRASAPTSADQLGDVASDDVALEGADRRAGDVVAPAGREQQRVPRHVGVVETQCDVRRGVVRFRVHRVRPVELARGREADIDDVEGADAGHGSLSLDGGGRMGAATRGDAAPILGRTVDDSAAELVGVVGGHDLGAGVDQRLDRLAVDGVEGRLGAELTHPGRELGDRSEFVAGDDRCDLVGSGIETDHEDVLAGTRRSLRGHR